MSRADPAERPELVRGIGLAQATTLNMIDMIGVGPFITIPLAIAAAGGPQAMLGWIVGLLIAIPDTRGPHPPIPKVVKPAVVRSAA